MGKRIDFAGRLTQRTFDEFREDGCPQLAAAVAYHALFSLFPLVLLLTGVFGIVVGLTGTQADLVDLVVRRLPLTAGGDERLRALLNGATGRLSTLGVAGIVGVIYGASGMMTTIRLALNRAWDVEAPRPFLRGKLFDLGLLGGVALLALFSLALSIAARAAGATIHTLVGDTAGHWVTLLGGIGLPLVLGFAVVLLLYRYVPARAPTESADGLVAAAALAAAALTLAQNLFAVYIRHFGDYNALYGAVGAAMGFLLLVYLGSLILLAGAELASEWPRVRADHREPRVDGGTSAGARLVSALRSLWSRPNTSPDRRDS